MNRSLYYLRILGFLFLAVVLVIFLLGNILKASPVETTTVERTDLAALGTNDVTTSETTYVSAIVAGQATTETQHTKEFEYLEEKTATDGTHYYAVNKTPTEDARIVELTDDTAPYKETIKECRLLLICDQYTVLHVPHGSIVEKYTVDVG